MKIHSLKISKTVAGLQIPFDRIYLVKHEDRGAIKRLFQWAIVMPVTGDTLEMLRGLSLDAAVTHEHSRGPGGSARRYENRTGTSAKLLAHVDLEKERWFAAVPLLPRSGAEGKAATPGYLTATKWLFKKPKRSRKKSASASLPYIKISTASSPLEPREAAGDGRAAFNNQAYLQSPGRDVRPPCLLCPRMILRQAGECSLGDLICYSTLPLGIREYVSKNEEFPEDVTNE